jgi:hypothetical protein
MLVEPWVRMCYRRFLLRVESLLNLLRYPLRRLALAPCRQYQVLWSDQSAGKPSKSSEEVCPIALAIAWEIEVNATPNAQG